jgi:putative transposase
VRRCPATFQPASSTSPSATPPGWRQAGAITLAGTAGDSYHNALAETIIGLYKAELIRHRGPWPTAAAVGADSTPGRLYGPLGSIPPAEYEQNWLRANTP